jgi:hypothetical protein
MRLPTEAREGLARAWLEILKENHPGVSWVLVDPQEQVPLTDERELSEAA